MSMMSSAAARARDSDSCEFPVQGLEAIAHSGMGWRAFSNMFLATLYAQLQHEASKRSLCSRGRDVRIELGKELAHRIVSVFAWAHTTEAVHDLRANLSPAGRRVVQAAHDALGQEVSSTILELLETLAVRDTAMATR
eukprot:Skav225652  [mRNA]  locus=scaffold4659:31052:31465:- [translate_table: standard]